jgi:hypothetical protein
MFPIDMKNIYIIILMSLIINTLALNYGICQRSLTKTNNLTFDVVFAGTDSEVLISDATAAKFTIYTNSLTRLTISFVLPAVLTSAGNPDIPVTFDMAHCSYRKTTNNPTGSTYFDPNTTLTISGVKNREYYYVWLGGVAHPPNGTPPATYTATITITTTQY